MKLEQGHKLAVRLYDNRSEPCFDKNKKHSQEYITTVVILTKVSRPATRATLGRADCDGMGARLKGHDNEPHKGIKVPSSA